MLPSNWETTALWGLVLLAGLIWLAIGLYSLWRAGRMSDRVHALQDLTDFLDTMIKTDHRMPVWIWADGRMQADAAALALIGGPNTANDIGSLVGEEGEGLPAETIASIKEGLQEGKPVPSPVVVDRGNERQQLILDLQWLPSKDSRWPHVIMWVEDLPEPSSGREKVSVVALELRCKA